VPGAKEKGLVKLTYTTCATAHAAIAVCQSVSVVMVITTESNQRYFRNGIGKFTKAFLSILWLEVKIENLAVLRIYKEC